MTLVLKGTPAPQHVTPSNNYVRDYGGVQPVYSTSMRVLVFLAKPSSCQPPNLPHQGMGPRAQHPFAQRLHYGCTYPDRCVVLLLTVVTVTVDGFFRVPAMTATDSSAFL
jgi:hypothetical protein